MPFGGYLGVLVSVTGKNMFFILAFIPLNQHEYQPIAYHILRLLCRQIYDMQSKAIENLKDPKITQEPSAPVRLPIAVCSALRTVTHGVYAD
jgi:hypothetical protein